MAKPYPLIPNALENYIQSEKNRQLYLDQMQPAVDLSGYHYSPYNNALMMTNAPNQQPQNRGLWDRVSSIKTEDIPGAIGGFAHGLWNSAVNGVTGPAEALRGNLPAWQDDGTGHARTSDALSQAAFHAAAVAPLGGIAAPRASARAMDSVAFPGRPAAGDYMRKGPSGLSMADGISYEGALPHLDNSIPLPPLKMPEPPSSFRGPSPANDAYVGRNGSTFYANDSRASLPAIAGSDSKGIRAYHGSPHDFNEFDLSKIGTGEGAQSFGHGLYFAENEAVAKSYRDQLSAVPRPPTKAIDGRELTNAHVDLAGEVLATAGNNRSKAIAEARYLGSKIKDPIERQKWASIADILEKKSETNTMPFGSGHMYEVNIKADPEHFLDWDRPLSQQSENLRNGLQSVREKALSDFYGKQGMSPDSIKSLIASSAKHSDSVPEIMQQLMNNGGPYTHKALTEQGIPGIKYLDQGSRTAGEGSRNYVVFDDKLIEILRKYGLLPPALGAASGRLDDKR